MKRWFLTVDWCDKGERGLFCSIKGTAFSQETEHTEQEIHEILDAFALVLSPKSIEFTEDELKEYTRYYPLAEYSNQYGIVRKQR